MSNKLDPVHAVASMALALVEIQKDLNQLHRKFIELTDAVTQMDASLIAKFKGVDGALNYCLAKLKEEVGDATDEKGKQGDGVDEKDLRSQEGEAGLLRDGERGEAEGGSREEQKEE
jgi:hypothetical protein